MEPFVHRRANVDFAPDQALSDLTEIDYYENDIFLRELVIKSLVHLDQIIEDLGSSSRQMEV